MKTIFILSIFLICLGVSASDRITALITLTNKTVNGQTLNVNGNVRTWTNNAVTPSTQILTNADTTGCGSKTNLYEQIGLNLFSGLAVSDIGSNSFSLTGICGGALTVSASAGWATVSYSTQICTTATSVLSPFGAYPLAATRTNIASQAVTDLNTYDTNAIDQTKPIAGQMLGTNKTQTAYGVTTLNNPANVVYGTFIGGVLKDTNGVIRFQADAAQLVINGTNAENRIIIGGNFTEILDANGNGRFYADDTSVALQDNNAVNRFYAGANGTFITGTNGLFNFSADFSGAGLYDQANQLQLLADTNGVTVTNFNAKGNATVTTNLTVGKNAVISGNFSPQGLTTNQTWTGTNNFPAGSDIAFGSFPVTSLANGNNAAVPAGSNIVLQVSGPTGAFTINGIANGRAGKWISIINQTAQTMTIANDSGSDPTAANRILTGIGADVALTNNPGVVDLWYSSASARWIIKGHN